MKYIFFVLFFSNLTLIGTLRAGEDFDEKQLSFYRGYLFWQEHLERPKMPYDLEQVIAGMRAAEKGESLSMDENKLYVLIREFQEKLLEKQTKENLIDAEAFLAKLEADDIVELVPKKLYYKQIKKGFGKTVQIESIPTLIYTISTYTRRGEEEVTSKDVPTPIALEGTIPGFTQGVAGMLEGEVRQIYIHPDLAYGNYGKIDPNLLVICKVEVVSANSSAKK